MNHCKLIHLLAMSLVLHGVCPAQADTKDYEDVRQDLRKLLQILPLSHIKIKDIDPDWAVEKQKELDWKEAVVWANQH